MQKEKKRVLGDEWKDWDGSEEPAEINEPKRLFIFWSFIALLIINAFVFLAYYLIYPRFYQISPFFGKFLSYFVLTTVSILDIWYALIIFEIISLIKFPFLLKTHGFFLKLFYPLSSRLSQFAGIKKDFFGNSFVKVSNILIGVTAADKINRTLILLPRCLKKDTLQNIRELAKNENIPVYVVGGGEQARRIIKKERPDSVIAVACERDLVAGINDVSKQIAVIGIPNKRPDGPCINTCIDIKEFENAVNIFKKNKTLNERKRSKKNSH